jgi:hypothetical protein
MTAVKNGLPQFEGEEVAKAAVRITNAGDGLSEALKVQPKALNMHDEVYYILRGEVSQVNHKTDKDDLLTRLHTIKASEITEVDPELAQKLLTEAAAELKRKQTEIDGQLKFDEEQAARDREAADSTDTPEQIAQSAADRLKSPFVAPPAGE